MIEQSASNSILFAHKASNLLESGASEEAIQICEEGVKRFPFYAEGHFVLGRCYQAQDRLDDARLEYERSLFYAPGHIKAIKSMAFVYYKKKQRQSGNAMLLMNALYEPFNAKLVEFLKSEDLYHRIYQAPPVEETKQAIAQPTAGESFQPAGGEPKPAAEAETDVSHEPVAGQVWTEVHPDEMLTVQSLTEGIAAFHETDEPPAKPAWKAVPYAPAESPEDRLLSPDHLSELPGSPIPVPEQPETGLEHLRFSDEVISGLPPHDERSGDTAEAPMLPGIDENFNNWADRMIRNSDHDQEQYELNNIVENIAESPFTSEKLNLSQFSNLQDDFMTIISKPAEEKQKTEREESWPGQTKSLHFMDETDQPASFGPGEQSADIHEPAQMEETTYFSPFAENETAAPVAPEEEPINLDRWMTEAAQREIREVREAVASFNEPASEHPEADRKQQPADLPEMPRQEKPIVQRQVSVGEYKPPQPPSKPVAEPEEGLSIDQILDNPNLVTPTFGEILIAQRKFSDARLVFQELSKRDPQNPRIRKKIDFLDKIITVQK
jgi:hypothetical protein